MDAVNLRIPAAGRVRIYEPIRTPDRGATPAVNGPQATGEAAIVQLSSAATTFAQENASAPRPTYGRTATELTGRGSLVDIVG